MTAMEPATKPAQSAGPQPGGVSPAAPTGASGAVTSPFGLKDMTARSR